LQETQKKNRERGAHTNEHNNINTQHTKKSKTKLPRRKVRVKTEGNDGRKREGSYKARSRGIPKKCRWETTTNK